HVGGRPQPHDAGRGLRPARGRSRDTRKRPPPEFVRKRRAAIPPSPEGLGFLAAVSVNRGTETPVTPPDGRWAGTRTPRPPWLASRFGRSGRRAPVGRRPTPGSRLKSDLGQPGPPTPPARARRCRRRWRRR